MAKKVEVSPPSQPRNPNGFNQHKVEQSYEYQRKVFDTTLQDTTMAHLRRLEEKNANNKTS